jgi:hypothetical protein
MRVLRTLSGAVVVVGCLVGALAGCGSSNKAATTAATRSTSAPTTTSTGTSEANSETNPGTFAVTLGGANGTRPGAPHASAVAVIKVNAAVHKICWRFTQLKNVAAPTVARIYNSTTGAGASAGGYPLGTHYRASGCEQKPAFLFRLIEAVPRLMYVGIDNARFPNGAVSGRL